MAAGATLAWGAAAFGAVYPWAYAPLLAAGAMLGLTGLAAGRNRVPWKLAAALAAIVAAAGLQLVPLDETTLGMISPRSLSIQQQRSLLAAVGGVHAYPLTIDPARTGLALACAAAFSLFAIGGARLLNRDSATGLAAAIAAIGVALAIAALVQRATYDGRIYGFWQPHHPGRPFGPFVNRNHFAGWMLMAVPLTIGLFARFTVRSQTGDPSSFRERLVWFSTPAANQAILAGFAILVMSMSLALTLSRSGIAAMALAMALASLMVARRPGSLRRRVGIPLYLAAVAMVALMWAGADRLGERLAAPGLIDSTGRRAIWAVAGRMIEDFWVAGTGLNTFGVAMLYYDRPFADVHAGEAHNDYLQLAAEGGVLLGVPIVAAIAALVVGIRRRLAADEGSIWWVRFGAVTGLLAIAVQSLVDFSLQIPGNAALFAALCAVALHDGGRRSSRAAVASAGQPPPPGRPHERRAQRLPGNVVEISPGDRPLTLAFDDDHPAGAAPRPAEIELSALDADPEPERQRAKFPFRAAVYYDAARRQAKPSRPGLAAALFLLMLVLLLLALLGGDAPIQ